MHDGCGRTRRRARRKLARCSSAQLPPGPEAKAEAHASARTHAGRIGQALTIDTRDYNVKKVHSKGTSNLESVRLTRWTVEKPALQRHHMFHSPMVGHAGLRCLRQIASNLCASPLLLRSGRTTVDCLPLSHSTHDGRSKTKQTNHCVGK